MRNRGIIIGLAIALAGVVLLVTLSTRQTPGPVAPPKDQSIDDPLDSDLLRQFEPLPDAQQLQPRGKVQQYRINSVNKKGQLIEMFGDSLTPLAGGVIEVESPSARMHLSPQRVLQIRARRGTLVAPDNQPRNGQFVGDVILRLYETKNSAAPDLGPDSPDVKLTVWLEEARFDLELGQVESDGPVHLATPTADFRGTGLNLVFNDRKQRLDRLVIAHGQSLRFFPKGQERQDGIPLWAATASKPNDSSEDNPPRGNVEPSGTRAHGSTPKKPPQEPAEASQFYRARFDSAVQVVTQGANVDADRLEVVFSLEGRRRGGNWMEQLGSIQGSRPTDTPTPTTRVDGHRPVHQRTPLSRTIRRVDHRSGFFRWMSQGGTSSRFASVYRSVAPVFDAARSPRQNEPAPTTAPANDEATTPPPDEVVITWDGPLTVEPEDSPPIDVSGPDDYLIQLVGRPIRVATAKGETLAAARAEYLASEQRLRLFGSQSYTLRLDAPELGVLTGEQLVVYQQRGIGQVLGQGRFESAAKPGLVAATMDQRPTDPRRLPRGLSVSWKERVDIAFNRPPGDQSRDAMNTIREITFHDSVTIHHPQMDLTADQLKIDLNPTSQQAHTAPGTIQATGHVAVKTGPAQQQLVNELHADELVIDLQRGEQNEIHARQLRAQGQVRLQRPGQLVRASQLKVELGTASPPTANQRQTESLGSAPGPVASEPPKIQIDEVWAQGDVQVVLDDPRVRLFADRLVADPQLGQLELFGTDQEPARIDQADGSLTGSHIVLQESSRSAHINGPGEFVFLSRSPWRETARETAAAEPSITDTGQPTDSPPTPPGDSQTSRSSVENTKAKGPVRSGDDPDSFPAIESSKVDDNRPWVTMTWDKAMHFEDVQGFVHFVGHVVAIGRSNLQSVELRAEDLQFKFTRVHSFEDSAQAFSTTNAHKKNPASSGQTGTLDGRVVTAMTARDHVSFKAQRYRPDGQQIESRLTLTGPLMTFDNLMEQIQILGPGTTLIEIYRDPQAHAPRGNQDVEPPNRDRGDRGWPTQLSGDGVTLVTWQRQMLLDAAHNDIQMDDQVQLVHRANRGGVTQLDCRSMLIDLEATGGLPAWFSGRIPKPSVKEIHADRDVRILSAQKAAYTDHLVYTGFDQTVLLRADEGKQTQFEDTDTGRSIRSESLKWDLANQRVEIARPSASRMSVGHE